MKGTYLNITEFGTPQKVIHIASKELKQPPENEVLVRMIARPVNPSDLIPIRGAYAHRIALPHIPGYEGVGIVEEVGSSVSQSFVGQRVLPLRGEGTWQEFVQTPAKYAVPVPDSIDDYTAAQMYINPLTAWIICTEELALQPNDVLLVNACGSSIGRLFAQLSAILGFKLIAITRNNKHSKELLELGASRVINTSVDALSDVVMKSTDGMGADAAIDSIGGAAGNALAACVRARGTFLTLGLLSGIQVNWAKIHQETKVNAKLFHLRHWNQRVSTNVWQKTCKELLGMVTDDKLKLQKPACSFDLTEIQKAIQAVESLGSNRGKVFLTN